VQSYGNILYLCRNLKTQNVMKVSQLITFLGGAFLGAIIALLLAPESGDETREKIKSKLEEKGIKLSKEQLDEFIESIKEKFNVKPNQEVIIDDEPSATEEA
jgi:gas vesicle protein